MGERSGTANGMCRRRRQQLATACTKASIGFPRLWLRKSADGATHTRADDMHPGPCYVHCCTSRQSVGLSVLRDCTHFFAESVCVTFYASMGLMCTDLPHGPGDIDRQSLGFSVQQDGRLSIRITQGA